MLEFVLGYSAGSATASRAAMLARSAAAADGSLHTNRIEDLNERLDSMAIILRALVSLLEERGLSAADLMAKIEELDLADGTADGRIKAGPVECSGCGGRSFSMQTARSFQAISSDLRAYATTDRPMTLK